MPSAPILWGIFILGNKDLRYDTQENQAFAKVQYRSFFIQLKFAKRFNH